MHMSSEKMISIDLLPAGSKLCEAEKGLLQIILQQPLIYLICPEGTP